jgi:hypothetical protein
MRVLPLVYTPARPAQRTVHHINGNRPLRSKQCVELLRVRARAYEFSEDRYGRPRNIRTRRGRSTLNMPGADSPLIVLDGARLIDLVSLRDLSVGAIESVELLNGIAGTATQGTNAAAGVIYIHTWEASERSGD